MKISNTLKNKRTLSFEIFPPKKNDINDIEKLYRTIDELKEFNPDFISVTYGANGSNNKNTLAIASYVKNHAKIETLAHLTCINQTKDDIKCIADELKSNGIDNILALRGDIPSDVENPFKDFHHASGLVSYLHENYSFGIACACYPEGHPESDTLYHDLEFMKHKEDEGATFFITQLFYDNEYYYRLVAEARRIGIKSPIIPGIMPITNIKTINRIKQMCGATLPLNLRNMLEKFKDNPKILKEIGYNYAASQILDLLAKGAPGIHLYIMNSSAAAREIIKRLENVFKCLF